MLKSRSISSESKKWANKLGVEKTGQIIWKESYHDADLNIPPGTLVRPCIAIFKQ